MIEAGRPARILLTMAAFVIVVAGMKASQELLVPVLLALFMAVLAASPMFWLQRKGLPAGLALGVVVLVLVIAGGLLAGLVASAITDFTQQLPVYQVKLRAQGVAVAGWLAGLGVDTAELGEMLDPARVMTLVGGVLNGLGGALANGFLILLVVIFMLLEAAVFERKFRRLAGECEVTLGSFQRFTRTVRSYFGIKAWMSFAGAVATGLLLLLIGVDYALLWAVLAFALNFIPGIGSVIAAVPPVLLALIQLGPWHALATIAAFVLVNFVMENIVEPRYMSRDLGLSGLTVFLSLLFWGWVLGPVGMLLSVPLTIVLQIALDASPETRWLAILLGGEPEKERAPAAEEAAATD
ncbi:MAG TPA: AI-2E family transporter [Gammaproteobacteria bacterium]|nr:AI-2E family transporter [Gammaproteobacteria bacterium]